jgi:hypothetical protein
LLVHGNWKKSQAAITLVKMPSLALPFFSHFFFFHSFSLALPSNIPQFRWVLVKLHAKWCKAAVLLLLSPVFKSSITCFPSFLPLLLFFLDTYSPGWPQINHSPASAFGVLGLQMCITMFGFNNFLGGVALNSGLCTWNAGDLLLEPHLQFILLWLFWRWWSLELFVWANLKP